MSDLLIRHIPEEGTLRSVDGAPNGILAVATGDGQAMWVVDSSFVPAQVGAQHLTERTEEENDAVTAPVEIEEVVAGCETGEELFRLAAMVITNSQAAVGTYGPERDFATIRAVIDLLEETLTAIEDELPKRGISGD